MTICKYVLKTHHVNNHEIKASWTRFSSDNCRSPTKQVHVLNVSTRRWLLVFE